MLNTKNTIDAPISKQKNLFDDDYLETTESIKNTSNNQQSLNTNNHPERYGFSVEGDVSMVSSDFALEKFPKVKDEVGYHLAIVFDDEDNLPWYQKLAKERRGDFLKNCLRIVLEAQKHNRIKKGMPQYFAGVIKFKTDQQSRLEAYKRKYKEHTTFIGYQREKYEKNR